MAQIAKQFKTDLIKKIQVAKDAHSFYFRRPLDFEFLPGNFIKIVLAVEHPDGRGAARFFSVASSPTEKDYLMITARIIESSFKKTLSDLTVGSTVTISGPYGRFIFDKQDQATHVFLAGGIGVTPFRSMIHYAADLNLKIRIIMLASFRTPEDIVFHKEFEEIANKLQTFTFLESITRPEESNQIWPGHVGRIDADMIKKQVPDISLAKYYIAGPEKMVNDLKEIVVSLGIDELRIVTERFTGY